eukprot:TRINITY_DN3858_c0_g1_i1.p1 TRINITY_DN3858_c0_g1~~TRINITY_DN3858_c0_g1_i1.p1  ORF type:complete len:465 (+),score=81.65 TRINITY_DN3858_c0_g1_i1:2-1396(+)
MDIFVVAKSGDVSLMRNMFDKRGIGKLGRDEFGNNFIHHAAVSGSIEMVAFLLERGIDVDLTNREGFTPLLMAAQAGQEDMVLFLIRRGADPDRKTVTRKGLKDYCSPELLDRVQQTPLDENDESISDVGEHRVRRSATSTVVAGKQRRVKREKTIGVASRDLIPSKSALSARANSTKRRKDHSKSLLDARVHLYTTLASQEKTLIIRKKDSKRNNRVEKSPRVSDTAPKQNELILPDFENSSMNLDILTNEMLEVVSTLVNFPDMIPPRTNQVATVAELVLVLVKEMIGVVQNVDIYIERIREERKELVFKKVRALKKKYIPALSSAIKMVERDNFQFLLSTISPFAFIFKQFYLACEMLEEEEILRDMQMTVSAIRDISIVRKVTMEEVDILELSTLHLCHNLLDFLFSIVEEEVEIGYTIFFMLIQGSRALIITILELEENPDNRSLSKHKKKLLKTCHTT